MTLDTTSEFANWVIDLRDGALQIQRVFKFGDAALLNCFLIEAGRYMKSPNFSVSIDSAYDADASAIVKMDVIPERYLVAAAGDLATQFEELSERVAQLFKTDAAA